MNLLVFLALLIVVPGMNLISGEDEFSNPRLYGAPLGDAPRVEITDVTNDPSAYEGKEVSIEGVTAAVCQSKGCWMYVTDGREKIRVDFKDYSFFVPTGSGGSRVRVQGMVHSRKVDKETLRHWAMEEPGGDPSTIEDDRQVIMITASGVLMENGTELSTEQKGYMKEGD